MTQTETIAANLLDELDRHWLTLGGGHPFVRPMMPVELDALTPCPEGAGPVVLVSLDPDGRTILRRAAALELDALQEVGLPGPRLLQRLLDAAAKPRLVN